MPTTKSMPTVAKRRYRRIAWTTVDDRRLRCEFSARTPRELEEIFGLEYEQIRCRARSLELKSRVVQRREAVNHGFFSVLTPASCYWAGFLMADGCIRERSVWIGLSAKDKDHLLRLAGMLGAADSVRSYHSISGQRGSTAGRQYGRVVLQVTSETLVTDLRNNFNVLPRKTLQPHIPPGQINADHAEAFLTGLIDGDGFIGQYGSGEHQYIRFGYIGSRALCLWGAGVINRILIEMERRPSATVREPRPGNWEMRCTGRNAQMILNRFKSKFENYTLPRKWTVLDEFNLHKKWYVDKTAVKDKEKYACC